MHAHPRRYAVGVLGLLALLFAMVFAGPASADPYSTAATISVNQSSVKMNSSVLVKGTGYTANSTVTLTYTLNGTVYQLGTVKTDSKGTFNQQVAVPKNTVGTNGVLTGTDTKGRTASTKLSITGNGVAGAATGTGGTTTGSTGGGSSGNGGGGGNGATGSNGTTTSGYGVDAISTSSDGSSLSATGFSLIALGVIALALLVVGTILFVSGRKRVVAGGAAA